MIVTIVSFPTPETPVDNPRALLEATAPAYRDVPGLRRKYFMGNAEIAGGIYEWRNRAAADAYYNDDWWAMFREHYGVRPSLQYYDAPCLVDNVAGEVVFDLPVRASGLSDDQADSSAAKGNTN